MRTGAGGAWQAVVGRWRRWSGHRSGDDRQLDRLRTDGFVALDLETTGLDPRRDVVVSLAAVPFVAGEPTGGYETLVAPDRRIPAAATRIHGITDAMVLGAPPIGAVLRELDASLEDRTIVGHSLSFDLTVLDRARRAHGLPRHASPTLCTQRLAAALHPEWADLTLDSVASRLEVPVENRHTARGDAVIAGRVLLAMLPVLARRGLRTVGDVRWLQSKAALHRAP